MIVTIVYFMTVLINQSIHSSIVFTQEMTVKNFLFVGASYTAYSLFRSSANRDWNSRELGFGFYIPTRFVMYMCCICVCMVDAVIILIPVIVI